MNAMENITIEFTEMEARWLRSALTFFLRVKSKTAKQIDNKLKKALKEK